MFYLILTKMEEKNFKDQIAELKAMLEEERKNVAFWRDRGQKLEARLTAIKSMVQGIVFFIE